MRQIIAILIISTLFACKDTPKQAADTLVVNAKIYTVDAKFNTAEAIAIKDGKIIAVGKSGDIEKQYTAQNRIDAEGKPLYPGFIDAHAHFYSYGEGLQECNLVGTKSWEEILTKLKEFSDKNTEGWLVGRGWDQNDWDTKDFPDKKRLDELFPMRPVILSRVDGHAAIVNTRALRAANIQINQKIQGGEIEVKNGQLTGILVDNAIDLVSAKIPPADDVRKQRALLDAQNNCFAVGLTSVVDCGLNYPLVEFIEKMNAAKTLKMRMNILLSDDAKNYDYLFNRGKIKTDYLNVRSFKLYADGALGSRGACLLHPYADRPNHKGFLLKNANYYESILPKIAEHGFQACTHAIGDSANREILRIYASILKGKNDQRWRIEHAQVIDPQDFAKFGQNNIIPSVQPTHATSDMY